MQAIQMDQGFTSVLSLVRSPEVVSVLPDPSEFSEPPGTMCHSCGFDSDRILSYEVTTATHAGFSDLRAIEGYANQNPIKVTPDYGMTSKCTPSFEKGKSLIVSH